MNKLQLHQEALQRAVQESESRRDSSAGEESDQRPGLSKQMSSNSENLRPLTPTLPQQTRMFSTHDVLMQEQGGSQGKQPQVPQTPQAPTNVVLSQDSLQQLINTVVQHAIQRNAQTAPIATVAAVVPTSKGMKLAEQSEFTGKPEDLDVRHPKRCIPTKRKRQEDHLRVVTNEEESAARWKSQYIRSNFSRGVLTDTWSLFKNKLSHAFQDVGQAQNAMKMLGTMKQGSQPIETFNTEFLIQGQKARMDFSNMITITHGQTNFDVPNPHAGTLIHMYQNTLHPKIAAQIIVNHPPNTINEWMS